MRGTQAEKNSLINELFWKKNELYRLEDRQTELENAEATMKTLETTFDNFNSDVKECNKNYNKGDYAWDGNYFCEVQDMEDYSKKFASVVSELKKIVKSKRKEYDDLVNDKEKEVRKLENKINNFVVVEEEVEV